jgi:2-dehydropantoate 2-reductase
MIPNNGIKILVVGGGGIGGITAAYLKNASYDITIYDTDEKHVEMINKKGLFIDGVRGEKKLKLNAITKLEDKYDIVFLSVKSLYTQDALESVIPHLKPSSLVVSLQSGINEEIISEKIGEKRTIGCIIGWGATNLGPGHLRQTSEGQFTIGRLDGTVDSKLQEIKDILDNVAETVITENIFGHLWSKLLINCCIATIGVCFAADVKKLVSNRKIIPIMIALTEELIKVPEHSGVKLEKFEDVLDMGLFRINDFNDYKRAVAIMKMTGEHHKGIKSSMWQDIEKGRRTEIDYINGYVEIKAEELGLPTPINAALIQLVKDIEQEKKTPSEDNIDDFYKKIRIPKKWVEYNFDDDPHSELALFQLPSNYKHQYATKLTGLQFIGLLTAFSIAFEKLTKSIIGKIFIRKSAWDIVNLVLSKYLQQIGEKFAKNIQKNYNLEQKDSKSIIKIFSFFLNTQNIMYNLEKFTEEESILFIDKNEDLYIESEKLLDVLDKIKIPITIHLLKAMAIAINEKTTFQFEDENVNGKKGYRIKVKLE